ncbi:hypothetical protein CVT24_000932 [Panaeolus cyanescens]|uniref:Cleavage stimulation factor subunit 2 hinge domain-containing protein n=1 Tax=Panaeolus cyanescens TaxID=181874 RepID=A0A409YTD5_9AGAR|nr:hypothetical protein CVT24_000932 [Panaeolus cyanescens]
MSNPNLATEQLLELLLTLKKTTPAAARDILNNQPAIAYALITLMVSMNAVDIQVFQKTLAEYNATSSATMGVPGSSVAPPVPKPPIAPTPIPPHMQAQYRNATPPVHAPTPPYPPYSNGGQPAHHAPPPPGYGAQYGQPQSQAYPSYNAPPPPGYGHHGHAYPPQVAYGGQPSQTQSAMPAAPAGLPEALANIPDDQKALIMRVISMTPEQINALPPAERSTYVQIRTTLEHVVEFARKSAVEDAERAFSRMLWDQKSSFYVCHFKSPTLEYRTLGLALVQIIGGAGRADLAE